MFHSGAGSEVLFQNRQVIATSLGCCCSIVGAPQRPDCWSFCNMWGKMGEDEMEDSSYRR